MLGIGWQEILVVLFIVTLIVGAKRLPEIGTGLGKTVREIKKIREEHRAGSKRRGSAQREGTAKEIETSDRINSAST